MTFVRLPKQQNAAPATQPEPQVATQSQVVKEARASMPMSIRDHSAPDHQASRLRSLFTKLGNRNVQNLSGTGFFSSVPIFWDLVPSEFQSPSWLVASIPWARRAPESKANRNPREKRGKHSLSLHLVFARNLLLGSVTRKGPSKLPLRAVCIAGKRHSHCATSSSGRQTVQHGQAGT